MRGGREGGEGGRRGVSWVGRGGRGGGGGSGGGGGHHGRYRCGGVGRRGGGRALWAEGQGGGWYAGWREASHIGAGRRGLRDWSKRSVAGADKKLHPKKVSPSPLRAPAPHRTSPRFVGPNRRAPARPASQPNLGYTLFLPTNPFARRYTENCSETNSTCTPARLPPPPPPPHPTRVVPFLARSSPVSPFRVTPWSAASSGCCPARRYSAD